MSELKSAPAPKSGTGKKLEDATKAVITPKVIEPPVGQDTNREINPYILDDLYPHKQEDSTPEAPGASVTKKRSRYVTIRHNASDNYKDPNRSAELGVDLYPGGFSREMELAAIERGGRNFYKTGLDEKLYTNSWDKEFLQESIEILRENFGEDVLDPFAMTFWKKQRLAIVDEETVLDLENVDNLLTYWNIRGGGYPYVASTPDELLKTNYRFFLEEPHLTYEVFDDTERVKDKAIRILSEMDDSGRGAEKMFFIHKMLITTNEGITFNTPKDIIYKALRRYIMGEYMQSNKKSAPKKFMDAVESFNSNQKIGRATAIVNDSIFYGLITTNRDGQYVSNETTYNFKTKDKDKLIEELIKFNNQDELLALTKAVQLKWNKY